MFLRLSLLAFLRLFLLLFLLVYSFYNVQHYKHRLSQFKIPSNVLHSKHRLRFLLILEQLILCASIDNVFTSNYDDEDNDILDIIGRSHSRRDT